jgi:hypothetical protein
MIQLSYQPALDPFHSIFRTLRLLPTVRKVGALHRDHLRILDFYLLFPFRISKARLIPKHRRFRRLAAEYEAVKPYSEQPDDILIFARMEPIQHAALETLAEKGILDVEQWRVGLVSATEKPVPKELEQRVELANLNEPELLDLVLTLATEYDFLGQNGLKDRTGLMEYRYDAI